MTMTEKRKRTRANGEASIRRRGKLWEARVTIGFQEGKQIRKSVYGKTRQEVGEKLAMLQAQYRLNALSPDRTPTLYEALDQHVSLKQADPEIQEATRVKYPQAVAIIKTHLPNLPLNKLGVQHIEDFYFHLATKAKLPNGRVGYSPATIDKCHQLLQGALERAVRYKLIASNPAQYAQRPRPKREPRARVLTPEERNKLLEIVENHRLYAMFYCFLALGLRRGEMCGLRTEDVEISPDGQSAAIHIRRQITDNRGKVSISPRLKTSASRRTLYLGPEGVAVLQQHFEWMTLERSRFQYPDQGWLFPATNGDHLKPRALNRTWVAILKQAKLYDKDKPLRLHDLRHDALSRAAGLVNHPRELAAFAGHANVGISLQIYTHARQEDLKEAALKIKVLN